MGKIMNRVFEISHKAPGQSQQSAVSNETQQKETEKKKRQTIGNLENGNSFKMPVFKPNRLGKSLSDSVCPEK